MLFPTITFATFFLVVFLANWFLMPFPSRWRWFMLAASYFFYGFWNWRFVGLLVVSTLANQFFAVRIERSDEERASQGVLIAGAVAVNLGLLGYFKYYGFFVESVNTTLDALGIGEFAAAGPDHPPGRDLVLHLPGAQLRDRHLPAQAGGGSAARFRRLPGVLSPAGGRADRARHRAASPVQGRSATRAQIDASRAFYLIAIGLAKKVVIADFLASNLVDAVFASPGQYGSLEILVAIYAYSIQIYADFSAYSDIAIGVALLLGFRFPDNFNAPYTAVSIQDFWRRWHMTLSRWLRDYLYIPLGGNRGGGWLTQRNLMLTMLLGGLWHGAAWRFVIWGGLHGLWLVWERQRAAANHAGAGHRCVACSAADS